MFTSRRHHRVAWVVGVMLALLCGLGSSHPAWGDPCADLKALADDLKAKNRQVTEDIEELAKAAGVKPPANPGGDRTRLSSAVAAYDHLRAAEKYTKQFDESDDGKRLISLAAQKATWDIAITDGDIAVATARSKNKTETTRHDDLASQIEVRKARLKAIDVPGAREAVLKPHRDAIAALEAEYDPLHAKIYDANVIAKTKARDDAKAELAKVQQEYDGLTAARKQRIDVENQAKAELVPYADLGTESQVRDQVADLDKYDAAVGKLHGIVHEKDLKLQADRALATAAEEAFNRKDKELSDLAVEEARKARDDANLDEVHKTLWQKNRDMKHWTKEAVKNRAINERKNNPALWKPKSAADARLKHWQQVLEKEIVEGNEKLRLAEADRLRKVRAQFLHLPCRVEEKEIDDKIREKIDFLSHPKGASLAGMENPVGEIPQLELPEDGQTPGEDQAAGSFGLVKKEVGKCASPEETPTAMLSGSESEGMFTFTLAGKPPSDAHATVTATYSTPPATLKPGDIIELTCEVNANITGKNPPTGVGLSAKWEFEGAVEVLEAAKAFAGYASDGKLYPSGRGKYKIKIREGSTIKLFTGHNGWSWGNDGKWYPCYYTYEWNKAPTETPGAAAGAATKPSSDSRSK